MCVEKDLFLNKRTQQPDYIAAKFGKNLTMTQMRDLVQAVYWVKCKYNFEPDDIADFLGITKGLVATCLNEPNPICQTCKKKLKKPKLVGILAKVNESDAPVYANGTRA